MEEIMTYINRNELIECLSIIFATLAMLFDDEDEKSFTKNEKKTFMALAGTELRNFCKNNNIHADDLIHNGTVLCEKRLKKITGGKYENN